MAAANMETEMVLPKRRGVEMRTSEARLSHELARRISACCCANVPGFSVLKNVRVHAFCVFKCVRCAVSMVYDFEEYDPLDTGPKYGRNGGRAKKGGGAQDKALKKEARARRKNKTPAEKQEAADKSVVEAEKALEEAKAQAALLKKKAEDAKIPETLEGKGVTAVVLYKDGQEQQVRVLGYNENKDKALIAVEVKRVVPVSKLTKRSDVTLFDMGGGKSRDQSYVSEWKEEMELPNPFLVQN